MIYNIIFGYNRQRKLSFIYRAVHHSLVMMNSAFVSNDIFPSHYHYHHYYILKSFNVAILYRISKQSMQELNILIMCLINSALGVKKYFLSIISSLTSTNVSAWTPRRCLQPGTRDLLSIIASKFISWRRKASLMIIKLHFLISVSYDHEVALPDKRLFWSLSCTSWLTSLLTIKLHFLLSVSFDHYELHFLISVSFDHSVAFPDKRLFFH
jgi:hypothetical protein